MKSIKSYLFTFLLILMLPIMSTPQNAKASTIPFIILSKYKTNLNIGEEIYLIAVTSNGQLPTWKSSSSAIASVNTYGKITAKKAGTVTITAKIKGAEASCKVTVNPTQITLSKTKATIERGETLQLIASTSDHSKITWKSSKKSVATIDENGLVTGQKPGETTITAKANGTQVTCTVKVKTPTISLSKNKITLYRGETAKLEAKTSSGFCPSFKSSSKSVAIVDVDGTITAIKNGTTTITATLDGVTKTCEVVVKKPTITLSKTELTLSIHDRAKLNATVSSGNSPTWTSSNDKIATVDENGTVIAHQKGRAYIYVSEDGTKVKCTVYVVE